MKKITSILFVLLMGTAVLPAQTLGHVPERPLSISLQGGPMYSRNENSFVYEYFNHPFDLVTWQGALAVGYEFSDSFGIRCHVGYANNPGAGNYYETNIGYTHNNNGKDDRYFPYSFKSVNGFADAVLHLNGLKGKQSKFEPQLYAGLGAGYTFNFQATADNVYAAQNNGRIHPWQASQMTDHNLVTGFRLGFIAEYNFCSAFGIFADICGEAYTDQYNGLMPSGRLIDYLKGYAGFPFDLRATLSLGMVFHFSFSD